MSTSLALINGDLSIGSGRNFQTVSNRDKLAQDLTLWVLERFGIDPDNPSYGSHIDDYIGQISTINTVNQIQNELIRLIQQYEAIQVANIKQDMVRYQGKTTLDASEVIASIGSINVTSQGTTIIAQVNILTLDGSTIQITLPVSN